MRHSRRNAALLRPANPQSRSLLTLGSRESVSAQSERGRKKFAQKPGPPPAQHVAAPGLSELGGFHSTNTIRKSGELEPNSLVTERGVGVGLPTPPDFHSGGPRIFSSTLCTTVWENTRRGAKNPPALRFAPSILGEREMHSGVLRKFLPPPGDKDRVQREHFVGFILLKLKMLSWALYAAGRSSLGS